jgi:hypothetical protein
MRNTIPSRIEITCDSCNKKYFEDERETYEIQTKVFSSEYGFLINQINDICYECGSDFNWNKWHTTCQNTMGIKTEKQNG